MHQLVRLTVLALLATSAAQAVSITDIQGPAYQSPLVGQTVDNVTGVVVAKDRYGLWLLGEPSPDPRVSNGLRVYGANTLRSADVGDLVSVSGRVAEYRSALRPNDLLLTELERPSKLRVLSSGHTPSPVVLGKDRIPPIAPLTVFDTGYDGWLSIPNNASLLEAANATLQPDKYGLDFWESLEGQLVTIEHPTALGFPDMFGSFWVHGDWPVSGKNQRGGLSLVFGKDGRPVAHSEAILIGKPIDRSRSPRTMIGMNLSSITGVVAYQFGWYSILPLTAPTVVSIPDEDAQPASIASSEDDPCALTIGDYNVENMTPRSRHIPKIADHIANYLNAPDIVFVQEISDDSGSADDGTVSANKTLAALVKAIAHASGGVKYDFVDIPPVDNMDGGKPGSNIRVAYLWRPDIVTLVAGTTGNATESTEVSRDILGEVTLSLNPGRIDPSSIAWEDTRKPIAAHWQTTSGARFFTVNVHLSSKRDSSSAHGDARPPVNGHADRRGLQVNVVSDFVRTILSADQNASVILGGDMNEFVQTRAVFGNLTSTLHDINEVSGVESTERYTYVYEQHTQEIDHIFVSDAVARRGTEVEHVHVNTWATSTSERASDHDATVAKVWVCDSSAARESGRWYSDSGISQFPLSV